jgi:hypothetical protein
MLFHPVHVLTVDVGFLKNTYPIKRSIMHPVRRVAVTQNWSLFLVLRLSCLVMSVFDGIAGCCFRRVYPYTLAIRLGKSLACMFVSGGDCGRRDTHKRRSDPRSGYEGEITRKHKEHILNHHHGVDNNRISRSVRVMMIDNGFILAILSLLDCRN